MALHEEAEPPFVRRLAGHRLCSATKIVWPGSSAPDNALLPLVLVSCGSTCRSIERSTRTRVMGCEPSVRENHAQKANESQASRTRFCRHNGEARSSNAVNPEDTAEEAAMPREDPTWHALPGAGRQRPYEMPPPWWHEHGAKVTRRETARPRGARAGTGPMARKASDRQALNVRSVNAAVAAL